MISIFLKKIINKMTNHFVNLVSWRYFYQNKSSNRKIHIDSFSLYLCCRLFGKFLKKKSGINFFHNNLNIEKSIFLLGDENKFFENKIILPFWESIDDVCIDNLIIKEVEGYESIVIGISSPKQDRLADLINEIYPKKNIFCLGAAIYTAPNSLRGDRLSLNWLVMMLNDFKRFKEKIKITIIEVFSIIFISKSRKSFKQFLKKNTFI